MYYIPEPPYFLVVASLLAGVASGIAFYASLTQSVQEWSKKRSQITLANMRGQKLLIPFLGISASICVFLAAGLQIFYFSAKFAYGVSAPLTLVICLLVWYQLGQILNQLERGGSKALDLDAWK